jgi:hypothetical protein
MLQRTPFEEPFLGATCYNLMLPIEPSDLTALRMARSDAPIFASAKIDASDDETARTLGQLGFRRICTQILLRVHSYSVSGSAGDVRISERLDLDPADVRAHALQLDSGRFRQDPLIPTEAATIYTPRGCAILRAAPSALPQSIAISRALKTTLRYEG